MAPIKDVPATEHTLSVMKIHALAYENENTCNHGRYHLLRARVGTRYVTEHISDAILAVNVE